MIECVEELVSRQYADSEGGQITTPAILKCAKTLRQTDCGFICAGGEGLLARRQVGLDMPIIDQRRPSGGGSEVAIR